MSELDGCETVADLQFYPDLAWQKCALVKILIGV